MIPENSPLLGSLSISGSLKNKAKRKARSVVSIVREKAYP
jgi:hypothetical protein